MAKKVYGYARVSSKDQNEERQLIALREFPVSDSLIFVDKQSGKDFNRPQYQVLLRKLREGDVLVIKSIDRLGRNYEEILQQWRMLTVKRRIEMVVLDMPLLDTRTRGKDLTGVFVADLVLQILSYVAQVERENIHQRQREGIEAAKARGVHFGRRKTPVPHTFPYILKQYEKGEISARKAGSLLGVSHSTFLTWCKKEQIWKKR